MIDSFYKGYLINQLKKYEICFDNEFFRGNDEYNVKSTGFNVSSIEGTVYLADKVIEGSDIGNLFLFRLNTDSEPEIVSTKFGTVNYETGEVLIDTVNITSTVQPDNIIEIQAIPMSNDVLARKELYLQLDVSKSNFFMRQDGISSGSNTSGTRYQRQSSYQNCNKTKHTQTVLYSKQAIPIKTIFELIKANQNYIKAKQNQSTTYANQPKPSKTRLKLIKKQAKLY